MKTKPPLALKKLTSRFLEDLTEEAESYFGNAPSPTNPLGRTYALAYHNDASAGVGGGTRCILWFETEQERLEVLANYLLVTNPGPPFVDHEVLSENICSLVSAHWNGELEAAALITKVNALSKHCFQIEWIGTRKGLISGTEDFPKWLRAQWRAAEPDDDSSLKNDEVELFFEYLLTDYGI